MSAARAFANRTRRVVSAAVPAAVAAARDAGVVAGGERGRALGWLWPFGRTAYMCPLTVENVTAPNSAVMAAAVFPAISERGMHPGGGEGGAKPGGTGTTAEFSYGLVVAPVVVVTAKAVVGFALAAVAMPGVTVGGLLNRTMASASTSPAGARVVVLLAMALPTTAGVCWLRMGRLTPLMAGRRWLTAVLMARATGAPVVPGVRVTTATVCAAAAGAAAAAAGAAAGTFVVGGGGGRTPCVVAVDGVDGVVDGVRCFWGGEGGKPVLGLVGGEERLDVALEDDEDFVHADSEPVEDGLVGVVPDDAEGGNGPLGKIAQKAGGGSGILADLGKPIELERFNGKSSVLLFDAAAKVGTPCL